MSLFSLSLYLLSLSLSALSLSLSLSLLMLTMGPVLWKVVRRDNPTLLNNAGLYKSEKKSKKARKSKRLGERV
jgi:hypothetical protein